MRNIPNLENRHPLDLSLKYSFRLHSQLNIIQINNDEQCVLYLLITFSMYMDRRSISGTPIIAGYNIQGSYFTSSNIYFKSRHVRSSFQPSPFFNIKKFLIISSLFLLFIVSIYTCNPMVITTCIWLYRPYILLLFISRHDIMIQDIYRSTKNHTVYQNFKGWTKPSMQRRNSPKRNAGRHIADILTT